MKVYEFYGDAAYAGIVVLISAKTIAEAREYLPKKDSINNKWDWDTGSQKQGLSWHGPDGIVHEYSWSE